ncbi:hypothetical protein KCU78_g21163, partial [Aureobasidium melanogenum]
MVLKIRLARFSKRHAPFYNIVVAHARTARGSKPLEVLGTYDPIPKTPTDGNETAKKFKDIKLDIHRAKYWLGVGAQPSEPAWRLLSMCGLRGAGLRETVQEECLLTGVAPQIGLMEPKYRPGQEIKKEGTVA